MKQEDFYRGSVGGGCHYHLKNNRIELGLEVFSKLKIGSLVDFGCGDGGFLEAIKKIHPELKVSGLDISKECVHEAREKGLDVYQHNFDQGKSCLENHSFDACFLGEVLEHVYSPDELFDEIARILKPGGWLFLTTPNLGAWFNRISLLMGYQPIYTEVSTRYNVGNLVPLEGAPAGHIRIFTYRALLELIKRSKLEHVRSYGIGLNVYIARHKIFYKTLNLLFAHPGWSSGIGILAKKPL